MFTFNGRDAHRTLPVAKIHLPFHRPIGEILPERVKTEDDEADPALQRLPAPGLRGTWARAYALLTRLVSQIGWDEPLKTRSCVFVMEEEYRMQKAQSDAHPSATTPTKVVHEDGTVVSPRRVDSLQGRAADADDDASTRGVVSPAQSQPDEDAEAELSTSSAYLNSWNLHSVPARMMRKWVSPIYAFYHPTPEIEYVAGKGSSSRRAHLFSTTGRTPDATAPCKLRGAVASLD